MKYVVAVSGGIDSVVLLDVLVGSKEHELVVAHFDHGIRDDSADDKNLVKQLAAKYNATFECSEGRLGKDASEAEARDARYGWLLGVKQKYRADAIVTAHHQDDIIETMIINLLRGTGWRGLISLSAHAELIRPLLSWPKSRIVAYAIEHNLIWREDSTNDDVRYLRNYVRYRYVQRLSIRERNQWVELHEAQRKIGQEIDDELAVIETHNYQRYEFIMSGREVAAELLTHTFGRMEKTTVDQLWHFICTGRPGKSFIQGGRRYQLTARELIVSSL